MKVTERHGKRDEPVAAESSCTDVLNAHLFESIAELRAVTDQWLVIYNRKRPHDSLGRGPPADVSPEASSAAKSPLNCPLDGEDYASTRRKCVLRRVQSDSDP